MSIAPKGSRLPSRLGLKNTPTASLQRGKTPTPTSGLVDWCCRKHRLHLNRGIRFSQRVSWIYDMKQFHGEVPRILELWRMQSTPLLLSPQRPLLSGAVALDRVLLMGQIELNCILMLNWIIWNRTVLTLKLRTYNNIYIKLPTHYL